MKRVQSPSSIIVFKQCPRKYYYKYIKELDELPSIHLIRGKVVHAVLEDFFKINIGALSQSNYKSHIGIIANDLFNVKWNHASNELNALSLSSEEISFYYNDTLTMIREWVSSFLYKLSGMLQNYGNLNVAFNMLKPRCEVYLESKTRGIRGFIDAIFENNGSVKILDYKTSRTDEFKDEYLLQLAIYAMLYYDTYGKKPDEVGVYFMKHGEKTLNVSDEMLKHAEHEAELIHLNTDSENVVDYPRKPSPLCKWATGQCSFYDVCKPFDDDKKLNEF